MYHVFKEFWIMDLNIRDLVVDACIDLLLNHPIHERYHKYTAIQADGCCKYYHQAAELVPPNVSPCY